MTARNAYAHAQRSVEERTEEEGVEGFDLRDEAIAALDGEGMRVEVDDEVRRLHVLFLLRTHKQSQPLHSHVTLIKSHDKC